MTKTHFVVICAAAMCAIPAARGASDPPEAPTSLSATAPRHDRVDMTWKDNADDEDGFKVERKIGAGPFQQVTMRPADTQSWSNTALAELTQYTYRVRAFRGAENSQYSNNASATTPLGGPIQLAVSTVSTTSLKLTWQDSSQQEDGFRDLGQSPVLS